MKIAFINIPLRGHVVPTLGVAEELTKQGHEVVYWLPHTFQSLTNGSNLKCYLYKSNLKDIDLLILQNRFVLSTLQEAIAFLPKIIEEIEEEKPDCVIADTGCFWGQMLAKALEVPFFQTHTMCVRGFDVSVLVPSAIIPVLPEEDQPQMLELLELYRRLFHLCHLTYSENDGMLAFPSRLIITFVPSWFDKNSANVPKAFKYVGPTLTSKQINNEQPRNFQDSAKTKIYASLGTVFNKNVLLLQNIVNVFVHHPNYELILVCDFSLQKNIDRGGTQNISLHESVNQREVLNEADLFISHGGINSIMESLYAATPMILLPQQFEQEQNAARIQELGLGIMLSQHRTGVPEIRQAIKSIVLRNDIKQNVINASRKLKTCNSSEIAADLIVKELSMLNSSLEAKETPR